MGSVICTKKEEMPCSVGVPYNRPSSVSTSPDGTAGDAYLTLRIVLPDQPDPALEAFVTDWEAGRGQDPRAGMER